MAEYRAITEKELNRDLFRQFHRRQIVTRCRRKENGQWVLKNAPFMEDWNEKDYAFLVTCLRGTLQKGGFVYGAFIDGVLKGFVSVEAGLFGGPHRYLDLSSLHVSAELRGRGIGRTLFLAAGAWARSQGAGKLYISSHPAVETQAFYQSMGCREAAEYHAAHVEKEPKDCQLECELQ